MKVLIVGFPYVTANQQPKLRSIAAQGVELNVLVPANWTFLGGPYRGDVYNPSSGSGEFGYIPLGVWRPGHIASHCHSPLAVCRTLAALRPDLVHVENEGYSYLAAQIVPLARTMGIKTTMFVWENVDKRLHWTQKACLKVTMPTGDGLVCGSSGAEAQYRNWGFKGRTCVVPQLGVDTELFRTTARETRSGPFVIGYVGRMVPEKGIDLLLRAIRLLTGRGLDLRCVICGAGPERDQLTSLSRELGIEAVTSFQDAVDYERVPEVLGKLDVLVLPSRTAPHWAEQLGHILLEAMSVGTVVVGARSGAIPEVIRKEDLLFNENSPEDLARVLLALATDSKLYCDSRAFCLDRIASNYTHDIIAEQLTGFWRSVAGGSQ